MYVYMCVRVYVRERVAGFVWEYMGCVLLCLVGLLAGHEKAEGKDKATDPGMGIY